MLRLLLYLFNFLRNISEYYIEFLPSSPLFAKRSTSSMVLSAKDLSLTGLIPVKYGTLSWRNLTGQAGFSGLFCCFSPFRTKWKNTIRFQRKGIPSAFGLLTSAFLITNLRYKRVFAMTEDGAVTCPPPARNASQREAGGIWDQGPSPS